MQQFRERPENGLAFLILFLDLRFKKKMNVIGHDAGGIKLIAALVVTKQKAFQHEVSRFW